ncbi:hypothetical protein QFC22_001025 [Naganishia vaughanmartiniae]|uniref:Uncharacterized protein n=1 Tax=Naganishia vaughanmartiniae TaxID=1424756 RepID=A0ACC2XLT3_9TREE|nr:hypothetical protein QFC22_001025 [Naganishia vaughanmartiniae]
MNALYSTGTRQLSSIQRDLDLMASGKSTPAIQGQILATLNSFSRVIDDYDQMAKKETKDEKREKALLRVQRFKEEHRELKSRFEQQKRQAEDADRSELLGTSGNSTSIGKASGSGFAHRSSARGSARQRANAPSSPGLMESPFSLPNTGPPPNAREDFGLREHTFLQETEASLDQYIAQGRAVLGDLVEQGTTLKGTKKRLLKAGETLGLSREVIQWVDRRGAQDWYIFFGGALFTLFMFWVIYHYLG